MHKVASFFDRQSWILYASFLFLCFPAFFINLGITPLYGDEPTRAIVALELLLNDNIWVPTINGEYYYNKPPLYNWILLGLFQLSGRYDEWIIRLPSVLSLFAFAITLYYFVKPRLGRNVAFAVAVMQLTNGRILIYSSLLGHIDIFYSWLTFASFIAMFHFYGRRQWFPLFAISYSIAAIGFLQKGFPSVVFQGFSLIALFAWHRNWRGFFSWQHVAGGLLFLLITGGYFLKYSQYNEVLPFLDELWNQSQQRTISENSPKKGLSHLISFPFENIMHLAPWSLLAVCFFRRGFVRSIRKNELLLFSALLFIVNIPVYWLSPQFIPRYIFALYPFLYILLAYFYYHHTEKQQLVVRWLEYLFLALIVLASLAVWAVPFSVLDVPFLYVKVTALFISLLFSAWLYYHLSRRRLLIFGIVLLLFRIGFDWFVLTHRLQTNELLERKEEQIELARMTKGEELYIYKNTPLTHNAIYYISNERKEILRKDYTDNPDYYYIGINWALKDRPYDTLYEFGIRYRSLKLMLVRLHEEEK